jgi:hypothetical protein
MNIEVVPGAMTGNPQVGAVARLVQAGFDLDNVGWYEDFPEEPYGIGFDKTDPDEAVVGVSFALQGDADDLNLDGCRQVLARQFGYILGGRDESQD